jgi:hypothetical protein
MLGEPGQGGVSQAAWIHSLSASYVKAWESKRARIGGLFGARVREGDQPLPWSRLQQAAFLILVWRLLERAVADSNEEWAETLRATRQTRTKGGSGKDPAFSGQYSLLNTDQGVRAVLQVTNDLCFVRVNDLELESWRPQQGEPIEEGDFDELSVDERGISEALKTLDDEPVRMFIEQITERLASYDWRTAAFPKLTDEERTQKLGFRGSGGYKELRRQLLIHLEFVSNDVGESARQVRELLGY